MNQERQPHNTHRVTAEQQLGLMWLVFLAVPIILTWTFDRAGTLWQIVGTIATFVFGVGYTYTLLLEQWPRREGRYLSMRQTLTVMLLLAVPIAATVPALGASVTAFAPYVAAMGVFGLPIRGALMWSTATLALTVAIPMIFEPRHAASMVIGPIVGVLFLTLMRLLDDRSEAERRAQTELEWVQEREAISRDIHDILGHTLTIVSLKTQLARRTLRTDPDRAEAELDALAALNQRALQDVRATVGRLRTPDLASQVEAAETALEASGIETHRDGSWNSWGPDRRALAAWAIRESTTNIIRHAQATQCRIHFTETGFTIRDNGTGIADAAEGYGLSGLRRRVADGGGNLVVRDTGRGTEVRVEFT